MITAQPPAVETAPADPRLLTSDEVAAMLSVHRNTVLQMVNRGDLPRPMKIGPRLNRWQADALAHWIAAGCPAPGHC
jgi:excisionase family DNA binding protein